jgi:hypothetical protein
MERPSAVHAACRPHFGQNAGLPALSPLPPVPSHGAHGISRCARPQIRAYVPALPAVDGSLRVFSLHCCTLAGLA